MSDRVRVDTENNVVRATRTIRESGHSAVLTIPPQVLDASGIAIGDEVEVVGDMDQPRIEIKASAP